jgi:hypothetical protein
LCCSGCNKGLEIVEVEGVITQDSQPLNRIMVEFWPENPGPRSIGTTDQEGRFSLMTDDGKHSGAVPGTHRIVLKDAAVLGDKFLGRAGEDVPMGEGRKPRIDGKYSNITTTPLTERVEAGEKKSVSIDAKKKL